MVLPGLTGQPWHVETKVELALGDPGTGGYHLEACEPQGTGGQLAELTTTLSLDSSGQNITHPGFPELPNYTFHSTRRFGNWKSE